MNFKSIIITGCCLTGLQLSAQSSGQNITSSPYSNFGLGEILNQNLIQSGSMGQTWSGAYSYSLLNPATLGNLRYSTLDFGVGYKTGQVKSGSEVQGFHGGSLNYLNLAFPTLQRNKRIKDSSSGKVKYHVRSFGWNSYFSLYPSTSVGYNYTFENTVPFKTSTAHSGKGGVNNIEFGNALRFGKYIRLGYSVAHQFGQLSDRSLFTAPDSFQYDIIDDLKVVNIRGLQQTAGLLFQFSHDSIYHRIGFSYRWNSNMKAQTQRLARTLEYQDGGYSVMDTVMNQSGHYTKITMPASFGVGYYVQYRRRIGLGLDYRVQKFGNYAAFFQPALKLADRKDYGITLVLNPEDEKTSTEKHQKFPVRIGATYSSTQNVFTINNQATTITETGAFIGFGIPFTRRYFDNRILRSVIQVQVNYLQRGKDLPGLAMEKYLMVNLGFNLGDIWFQRRKYD